MTEAVIIQKPVHRFAPQIRIKQLNYGNQNMNKYIFYQTGVIMLYISSQQSNFILFLTPISAFDTLMIVGEFANIAICQATV